jgi:hypothetical protein
VLILLGPYERGLSRGAYVLNWWGAFEAGAGVGAGFYGGTFNSTNPKPIQITCGTEG